MSQLAHATELSSVSEMHTRKTLKLFAAIIFIGAVALVVWWRWLDTYHLVTVHDGILYRDGNRGMREFTTAVRATDPRTVVCLVDDDEIVADEFVAEQQYLQRNHIEFIRIPVIKGKWPTTEQLRQFLEITCDRSRQPVLMHDNEGVRRAGMFAAAYQESVMGFSNEQAWADIRTFDHSERSIGDVREFIRLYDGGERVLRNDQTVR